MIHCKWRCDAMCFVASRRCDAMRCDAACDVWQCGCAAMHSIRRCGSKTMRDQGDAMCELWQYAHLSAGPCACVFLLLSFTSFLFIMCSICVPNQAGTKLAICQPCVLGEGVSSSASARLLSIVRKRHRTTCPPRAPIES